MTEAHSITPASPGITRTRHSVRGHGDHGAHGNQGHSFELQPREAVSTPTGFPDVQDCSVDTLVNLIGPQDRGRVRQADC